MQRGQRHEQKQPYSNSVTNHQRAALCIVNNSNEKVQIQVQIQVQIRVQLQVQGQTGENTKESTKSPL